VSDAASTKPAPPTVQVILRLIREPFEHETSSPGTSVEISFHHSIALRSRSKRCSLRKNIVVGRGRMITVDFRSNVEGECPQAVDAAADAGAAVSVIPVAWLLSRMSVEPVS